MKILMMPFSLYMGHNIRLVEIAIELRSRGHDVVFACEFDDSGIIKDNNFRKYYVKEYDKHEFRKNVLPKLKFNEKMLKEMINSDLDIYKKIKPDLIISDFRLSAQISAEIARIKIVTVLNIYSTHFSGQKQTFAPDFFLRKFFRNIDRFAFLMPLVKKVLFIKSNKIFNKIRDEYGIIRKKDYLQQLEGDKVFICDLEELFKFRKLPEKFYCIGPLYYGNEVSISIKKKSKKTIYLSMGSEREEKLMKKVISLIDRDRYQIVITNKHTKISMDGIINMGFSPALSIIRESDIVICHGGNGTIYQSLSMGKPIIAIPFNLDHNFNADAIDEISAGKKLLSKDIDHLPMIIEEVLTDPTYKKKSEYLSILIKNSDAARKAADLIENEI
jgi:UDP:flavonoid glycosyltransferase YjiC (YdhE family)